MARWILVVLAVLSISSGAHASLHQFVGGSPIVGNTITVLGSGIFEVSDTPTNGFQYLAINPLQLSVDTDMGPLQFDLLRVSTLDNAIAMVFDSMGGKPLTMTFDVAGTMQGDPLPPAWADDDGEVGWNTNNMVFDPTGKPLWGRLSGSVAAVPEPSAFGFGAVALAVAGCGRFARRRWLTKAA